MCERISSTIITNSYSPTLLIHFFQVPVRPDYSFFFFFRFCETRYRVTGHRIFPDVVPRLFFFFLLAWSRVCLNLKDNKLIPSDYSREGLLSLKLLPQAGPCSGTMLQCENFLLFLGFLLRKATEQSSLLVLPLTCTV